MIRLPPDDMARNIIMLSITTRTSTNKVFHSGITKTSDKWGGKGKEVNPLLGYFVNILITIHWRQIYYQNNAQLQQSPSKCDWYHYFC